MAVCLFVTSALIISPVLVESSKELHPIRRNGMPQIWNPDEDRPLPIYEVYEYIYSGGGGLNNIMWAVGRAIHSGYDASSPYFQPTALRTT